MPGADGHRGVLRRVTPGGVSRVGHREPTLTEYFMGMVLPSARCLQVQGSSTLTT